jgi:glucose-6-phosphate isomerase
MDLPFTFPISMIELNSSNFDTHHIQRRLSDLHGQFSDQEAYEKMVSEEDTLLYDVYEIKRPEVEGEMLMGFSILHPGKVGDEFFMTKGHFHSVLETSEVYYCVRGEGYLLMETPEGDTAVETLTPGNVVYVPPRWAHRSVCTSRLNDLITFYVYPANAGHDYGTIEQVGFRKMVVDSVNGPKVIDNPRTK